MKLKPLGSRRPFWNLHSGLSHLKILSLTTRREKNRPAGLKAGLRVKLYSQRKCSKQRNLKVSPGMERKLPVHAQIRWEHMPVTQHLRGGSRGIRCSRASLATGLQNKTQASLGYAGRSWKFNSMVEG